MIRIAYIDANRAGPIIECDVCGFVIEQADLALACWKSDNKTFPENGKIHFVHKSCHMRLEGDDPDWMCDEVDTLLRRLAHNCNAEMTPQEGDDGKEI